MAAADEINAEVIALARAGEPDRYLAATLAPATHRAALIAIAAFAADLRRIPSAVKEPMMGEIRLQWWRDVIEGFKGEALALGHPVADALRDAVRRYGLSTEALVAMTEARAFDLYPDPMPDRAAFDGYISRTEAVPFMLALSVLGASADTIAKLGDMAGRAYGVTRLLAELPYRLQRGRHPLPLDLLAAHGADVDSLLTGTVNPPIRAALGEIVSDVRSAYEPLRSRWRELPRDQRAALLPIATITSYLAGFESAGRDPLREPFELSPLICIWRIARAHWIGP